MELKTINPKQLQKRMQEQGQVLILDVRAAEKYETGHIEGDRIESRNIPKNIIFELELDDINDLPKNQEIIVTCTTGNSAKKCAEILKDKQYDVTVLEGGFTAWKALTE